MAGQNSPTLPAPFASGRLEACRFGKQGGTRFCSAPAVLALPSKWLNRHSSAPDNAPATAARKTRLTAIGKNHVHGGRSRCTSSPYQTTRECTRLRAPISLPVHITENAARSTFGALEAESAEKTPNTRHLSDFWSQAEDLTQYRRSTVTKTGNLKDILLPPQPTTVIVAVASPKPVTVTSPRRSPGTNVRPTTTAAVGSHQPPNSGVQSPLRPSTSPQRNPPPRSAAVVAASPRPTSPQKSGAQSPRSPPRGSPKPSLAVSKTPLAGSKPRKKDGAQLPSSPLRCSPRQQTMGATTKPLVGTNQPQTKSVPSPRSPVRFSPQPILSSPKTTAVGANLPQNDGVQSSRSPLRSSPQSFRGEYVAPATAAVVYSHEPQMHGAEPPRLHHGRQEPSFVTTGDESRSSSSKSSIVQVVQVVEVEPVKRKTVAESFVDALPLFLLLIVLCLLCIWAIHALRSYKPAGYSYTRRQNRGLRDSAADSVTVYP